MSTTSDVLVVNPRRRALVATVSAILQETGVTVAERAVVETLAEMLQSCLIELARSSRAFCELTGRTEAVVGDVIIAMVEMGIKVDNLPSYAKRGNRISLTNPSIQGKPFTPKILQAGDKKSLPSYIPEHYPPFPDPHAYIRTPTHKQPVTEYEAIREKAASQKRDVERALTRFVAKTGATQSLFTDDTSLYPLIACKLIPNPYLAALLPKDQIFESEEESTEENRKKGKIDGQLEGEETAKVDSNMDSDVMDNPYLRPIKMPRKRRR